MPSRTRGCRRVEPVLDDDGFKLVLGGFALGGGAEVFEVDIPAVGVVFVAGVDRGVDVEGFRVAIGAAETGGDGLVPAGEEPAVDPVGELFGGLFAAGGGAGLGHAVDDLFLGDGDGAEGFVLEGDGGVGGSDDFTGDGVAVEQFDGRAGVDGDGRDKAGGQSKQRHTHVKVLLIRGIAATSELEA